MYRRLEKKLQRRQEKNIKDRAVAAIFDLGRGYEERTRKLIKDVFEDSAVKFALGDKDDGVCKAICENLVDFLERLKNQDGKSGRLRIKHTKCA